MDEAAAHLLGPALAAIDPWARMSYPAAALTEFLARRQDGVRKYAVSCEGALAGAVSVQDDWLKGPYLQLLGLLPGYQGRGIGSALMGWFEAGAVPGARNLWVVVSAFNDRAAAFYRAHGYEPAATLPDLVADGYDEILLRKFPLEG
jgi:ribosomal protein S18 acetylase RimI-like enzyme